MPPPTPPPRPPPRQILSEDDYTSTLTQIITRDYYPSLPTLERDLSILHHRSVGDIAGAVAVRRAARRRQLRPPNTNSDDDDDDDDDATTPKRERLQHVTLTKFHERATSEDNEEYERVQRTERKERRRVFRETFSRRGGVVPAIEAKDSCETPLLASDRFDPPAPRLLGETTDGDAKRNELFFTPRREERLSPSPSSCGENAPRLTASIKKDKRRLLTTHNPASTTNNNRRRRRRRSSPTPDSELMPPPPPVTIPTTTRSICPSQTRFPHQSSSRLPSTTNDPPPLSTPSHASSSETTDIDATPLSLAAERAAREESLSKPQRDYVRMTPLIVPGGTSDASPLVTWGDVSSTPLVVRSDDKSREWSAAFTVADEDEREMMARGLSSDATKRQRRPTSSSSVPPATTTATSVQSTIDDRASSLTPAARSLLSRTSHGATPRRLAGGLVTKKRTPRRTTTTTTTDARDGGSFGAALRECYSTTPRRRGTPVTSRGKRGGGATPRVGVETRKERREGGVGNLTDGLLQLG